jgi:hypothetical protein
MTADFDNVLRLREHEFNLRMDEMRTVLLSHEIKVNVHQSGVRLCVCVCVLVRARMPVFTSACLQSCNEHICIYVADRYLDFRFVITLKRYTLQYALM